ncbi:MAG: hypothetical protein MZV63_65380 [Marinilabiliales bacterium]|nr:hypothetical protein [Marinilabiliales bacterium]
MTNRKYALGLDFGTNSVRALVVDVTNGDEVGTAIFAYPSGQAGILLDPKDTNLARQNPADWILGIETAVPAALAEARKKIKGFDPASVVGIGVDTDRLDPSPRRPRRQAARPLQGAQEEPERPGLALEGPHRPRRSGRDHRPRRGRAPRISRQVRRDLFLRVVLEQDPPLPAHGPQGRLGRLLLGRVRRLHPRPPHRRSPIR